MIALLAQSPADLSTFERILKDYGGWGALAIVVALAMWFGGSAILNGGRAFMALAKKFSDDVVAELKDIKNAIQGNERRVDGLAATVHEVRAEQAQQGVRIDRLKELMAGAQCKGEQ